MADRSLMYNPVYNQTGGGFRNITYGGFDDISEATYISAYLVMLVGVVCAMFASRDHPVRSTTSLSAVFILWVFLEGLAFGLMGITHHLLALYHAEGYVIGKHWFRPYSEWMVPWTWTMFLAPLANACAASTAFARIDASPSWDGLAKAIGALVALAEVSQCFFRLEATGLTNRFWGFGVSFVGLGLVALRGRDAGALVLTFAYLVRFVGYGLVLLAPAACWVEEVNAKVIKGSAFSACPFPAKFNQNAMFNVANVCAIALAYAGVMARLQEASKNEVKRQGERSSLSRACCGI